MINGEKNRLKSTAWRKMVCLVVLLLAGILVREAVPVNAAGSLKLRYWGKTVNFTSTQLSVTLDNKSVNLAGMPGLSMKNAKKQSVYMVSAYNVFKKGLGASYSYSNGKITISKWGVTVKMTLNSKTAYVNGKKTTLAHPPVLVKYVAVKKFLILVPAGFTAKALGYTYSTTKLSSGKAVVKLTTPFYIQYDNRWIKYTRTQCKLTFDGTDIDVSSMPCIVMNEMYYAQAKAFKNAVIGAYYKYDASTGSVVIQYGENSIEMTLGETSAVVNGKTVQMPAAPELVLNGKTKKEYVMVPIAFVSKQLGFSYINKPSIKTCVIKRQDSVYLDWEANQVTVPNQTVQIDSVKGERSNESDVVVISGNYTEEQADIEDNGSNVTVTFTNVQNPIGGKETEIAYPYLLAKAVMSDGTNGTLVIEIDKKNENIGCEVEKEDGRIVLTLDPEVSAVASQIKIAVDCGHGAYTAGKRTPELLESLDFDGDGVIDAKKGTRITEHTANVGVGNYVAAALERCGFTVYRSAFGTEDISLAKRQANIKASKSDYSISIHFNAIGNGNTYNSIQGVEAYTYKTASMAGQSKALASAILQQVIQGTSQINHGVNSSHSFAMCNTEAMGTKASILLECAYMTNWYEVKNMMANEAYWEETGNEVARGFCNYTGVPYVEE